MPRPRTPALSHTRTQCLPLPPPLPYQPPQHATAARHHIPLSSSAPACRCCRPRLRAAGWVRLRVTSRWHLGATTTARAWELAACPSGRRQPRSSSVPLVWYRCSVVRSPPPTCSCLFSFIHWSNPYVCSYNDDNRKDQVWVVINSVFPAKNNLM
jgi:hypothetical protein